MTDYYSSTLKLHRNPTTVNPSNTRSQSYIYIYMCVYVNTSINVYISVQYVN